MLSHDLPQYKCALRDAGLRARGKGHVIATPYEYAQQVRARGGQKAADEAMRALVALLPQNTAQAAAAASSGGCDGECAPCDTDDEQDAETAAPAAAQTAAQAAAQAAAQTAAQAAAQAAAASGVPGILRAVHMRVCCANPTCRHLAAVIDEDKAAELEAEAQTAAAQGHSAGAADPFCDGNRRHGSPKLFFDNVCYVRELYVRRVVDAAGVDALLADLARLAYWVEVRQRETLGVAITIARNAETLHYPLRTSEAKSAFCDDMARAPHRFVCTVVADHVKDEVHFSRAGVEISSGGRRGQKQTWQSYLKNTLMHAKGYPDAFTLAHTHLRLSTFETNGCVGCRARCQRRQPHAAARRAGQHPRQVRPQGRRSRRRHQPQGVRGRARLSRGRLSSRCTTRTPTRASAPSATACRTASNGSCTRPPCRATRTAPTPTTTPRSRRRESLLAGASTRRRRRRPRRRGAAPR